MTAALLALALLFAASSPRAEAETIGLRLSIAPQAANLCPGTDGLRAGVATLFAEQYGRRVDLDTGATAGADASAGVSVGFDGRMLAVTTDMSRGAARRSLRSTVPPGSPGSLVSAIAGDIAFLWFSFRDFSSLPLSPPPPLAATLDIDTLRELTGWGADELEPIGLAGAGGGITICFPHRWLSLGPLFRVTVDTLADINAQAFGREPLQLSGIVRAGGQVVLLSEREGKIARIDLLTGTRRQFDAPGLSALGGEALDRDTIAVLGDARGAAGLAVHDISDWSAAEGAPSRRSFLQVAASYVSAFARDGEGNLWAWDAAERRLRILTPDGREVFSIKPLLGASVMQLPQQLAVFEDGSFLLGGSGEVWKFESSGIPAWRLTRVPGRAGGQLPASFALRADSTRKAFTLLDPQSRRLLQFAENLDDSGDLGALLSRLDGRNQADLEEAAHLAAEKGLSLMELQFADLLTRRGGPEGARATAALAVLRDRTRLYADLADSLMRGLLYEQAERAYLRAIDSARELTARDPDDADAARLLEVLLSRRREVRDGLSQKPDVAVVSAQARTTGGCGGTFVVSLSLRVLGSQPVSGLRVRLALPGFSSAPALAEIGDMPAGSERKVELAIVPEQPLPAARERALAAAALFTYARGAEDKTVPLGLTVRVSAAGPDGAPRALAGSLACLADPGDPLLARILSRQPDSGDALGAIAGALDLLGSLRRLAASPSAQAPVRAFGTGPLGVRPAARGLSPDSLDWALLSASLAASLGMQAGFFASSNGAFALITTDIPLGDAGSWIPGLDRSKDLLAGLSRDGRLCLPLSGAPQPPDETGSAFAWAVTAALGALARPGTAAGAIAWLDSEPGAGRARTPVPVPFPIPLPGIPSFPSRDTLREQIMRALEKTP